MSLEEEHDRIDERFLSSDPDNISIEVLEELIARFLVNLPKEEKEFPRLMINIRNTCWFYADNYFGITPGTNNVFQKKFARAIFEHWPYLRETGKL